MKLIETLSTYSPGDIVLLVRGTFTRYPGTTLISMNHLFVVVDDKNVCEISSKNSKVSSKFPYNVEILNWSQAGLRKPCHVKTDTYGEIDDSGVFKLIGHLSNSDLTRVLKSYQLAPQNYRLELMRR